MQSPQIDYLQLISFNISHYYQNSFPHILRETYNTTARLLRSKKLQPHVDPP